MSRESYEVSEQAFWTQFDHRDVDEHGCYPGQWEYEQKLAAKE